MSLDASSISFHLLPSNHMRASQWSTSSCYRHHTHLLRSLLPLLTLLIVHSHPHLFLRMLPIHPPISPILSTHNTRLPRLKDPRHTRSRQSSHFSFTTRSNPMLRSNESTGYRVGLVVLYLPSLSFHSCSESTVSPSASLCICNAWIVGHLCIFIEMQPEQEQEEMERSTPFVFDRVTGIRRPRPKREGSQSTTPKWL